MKFSGLFFFCVQEIISQIDARQFTWLHSTSYNHTENWSKSRLPCSTDTVVFPKDLRLTIEFPRGHLEMKELVLPRNGEIVFSADGSLSLSSQNRIDGACDGGTNEWRSDLPWKWLSPDSWSLTDPATPDLERVPCPTDDVVFPPGSTYFVVLPPFELSVSTITIKGTTMVGEDWDEFSMSPEGDRQFANGPLRSTGLTCDDPSGCECQADLLSRWICPEKTCPIPACLEPIQPLGDCCLKCGAFLLYGFSSTTRISQVESVVKEELEPKDVHWHVGRTMGYIQVVIVEKEYANVAGGLADKLDQRLLTSGLGLKKWKLESSGLAAYPGGPGQSILFFFISMIAAVALFTFFIVHYERVTSIGELFSRNYGRFSFARFENQSGAVELGGATASEPQQEENATREFANPMYSEDPSVLIKRKVIPKDLGSESLISSSETSSLSEAETEIIVGIPDQRNMEEIATGQLID
ncbi:unnamed protein product [Nezara viridula]|uniref:Protein amnionless n=1 Tax=Nezara viridula TaxID=85310 RepID=A0A9P0HKN8_NEZVI|nr:unnamed protein product [Nezara viridula]